MGMVLHKLNLTDTQKAAVKTIMADQKSQFQALRTSSQADRETLAATPPTDTAAYATAVAAVVKDATTRIQLMSETWTKVYGTVLTPAQQQAIPGIVAAAKAEHAQRMQEWEAQHSAAASTGQ
jgi:Spy/CpxP family protein refolding chaperone